MTGIIRILIADDHAILRGGLRLMIAQHEDMEVVGEASNGGEVLDQIQALRPDLVLLDIAMPGLNGLETLPLIKKQSPESRVLILTMHEDEGYLRQALQSGAAGYVLKKAVDSELINAIRAVVRGEIYIYSAMNQKLIESMIPSAITTQKDANPWKRLSGREYDVLRLVALGHTSAEIAEQLVISVKTVDTYRSRGMEKMELHTRAQLVRSALTYGILD